MIREAIRPVKSIQEYFIRIISSTQNCSTLQPMEQRPEEFRITGNGHQRRTQRRALERVFGKASVKAMLANKADLSNQNPKDMHAKQEGISSGDIALWFLAAFMALGLFLAAPRIGRGLTASVLIGMFGCLVHPIWQLSFIRRINRVTIKVFSSAGLLFAAMLIAGFGFYVWPPIKRHPLTARERESFENALKSQKGDDLEIQIACPPNDERGCSYAGQFIRPVGDSGWNVQSYVSRLTLTKPLDGIMIYRRGGNRDYSLQHYDAGGYFNINEPHLLAVQKAFQSMEIEPSGGTNPDLPENVMMIYFGPERENEAEPTDLTTSTEWATGKREGPFPGKRRTVLCRWLGLLCG